MKTIPLLLALSLLAAGCLGPSEPAGAPPAAAPEEGPDRNLERSVPTPPGGAAPPIPIDVFPFEGTNCMEDAFLLQVPVERLDPFVPPEHRSSNPTNQVRISLFSCDAATLADGAFRKDVHLLLLDTLIPATENETSPYYLLEVVTDWPALLDRFNATGTPSHLGTFTTTSDATSRESRVVADGLDYHLQAPLHQSQKSGAADSEQRLRVGPDLETLLLLAVVRDVGDNLFTAGAVAAEGGIAGAVTEGLWPGQYRAVQVVVRIEEVMK